MKIHHTILILFFISVFLSCNSKSESESVISSDVDRFWIAYDTISKQPDSLIQLKLLEDLYLSKATPGLRAMIAAKEYRNEDFLEMINNYPQFLASVRPNTDKAKLLSNDLEAGIEKLSAIYPALKPAKIYFTVGAMRSGGTTKDSLVLIGSELAMVDEKTNISEFEDGMKDWAKNYIATKPLENIVLLNVHEYVHTQQKPISNNLLHQCLSEGVAEFVSVQAMGVPSASPAIAYGKNNPAVKKVFEEEMFYDRTYQWLWSNAPNQFKTRDLGYYIGYEICELHYKNAKDKKQAIKEMIELTYANTDEIDDFIDKTKFFTKSIGELRAADDKKRPKVFAVKQFENKAQTVNPKLNEITIEFSTALDGQSTSVDYGSLGEVSFPKVLNRFWSADGLSWTMKVALEPEKDYQILIGNNFRTKSNIPLKPFLIEFRTSAIVTKSK